MTEQLFRPTVSVRTVLTDPRGNILILQRVSDNEWELPGGRLSPYETVCEGLHREVHEETALPLEVKDILLANSWLNDQNNHRLAVYYDCHTQQRSVSLSEEHMNFRWATRSEATSFLSFPQASVVRRSHEDNDEKPVLQLK